MLFLKIHLFRLGVANARGKRLAHPEGHCTIQFLRNGERSYLGLFLLGSRKCFQNKHHPVG